MMSFSVYKISVNIKNRLLKVVRSRKLEQNNNIAILESKIIYFCLRSNFREQTTLKTIFEFFSFF